jgi:hypothetical protein
MSTEDQSQDFEKLQRLLKLKRHEQPPPRFFNEFSGQVTARLRAGETDRLNTFEDVVAQSPWLQLVWRAIEGRPALSGIFTAGVCGLLLAGGFLFGTAPVQPGLVAGSDEQKPAAATPEDSLLAASSPNVRSYAVSTNPAGVLPGSLFSLPTLETMPASGSPIPAGAR